jgi:DNA-binding MarR family transcriptional regulator
LTPDEVAEAFMAGFSLLARRFRQLPVDRQLTTPERSALARLDRGGPATSADLARQDQISPQSMGATVSALEGRGLVAREADPDDGRRVVLSVTAKGQEVLRTARNLRVQQLAAALGDGFTPSQLRQLLDVAPLLEQVGQRIR